MITNFKTIEISRVILHVLTKGNDEIISNNILPLDDEDFQNFLQKHIRSSLSRSTRRSAIYNDASIHIIKDNLDGLFDDDDTNFIEATRNIANRLNGIIKQKNYNPYYFLICNYKNEDDENYVAMLLLDFSKSFYHEYDNNQVLIDHITSLSENNSRLKKCAILQPINHDNDFDLIINEPKDTDFFRANFLQALLYTDEKKIAEQFVIQTRGWAEDKLSYIKNSNKFTDTEKKAIINELTNLYETCLVEINTKSSISLNAFINSNLSDHENFREDYRHHLECYGLIEDEIIITDQVRNNFKVNKIRLDNGIQVIVPLSIVDDEEQYNFNFNKDLNASINICGKVLSQTVLSK